MRLSAKAPIVIRGEEITHLDADGYKHLPRATSLPDGKVLATSGGKWAPSDLSGISVSSVFGRTGAVTAQAGDYTPEQVGAAPAGHTHAYIPTAQKGATNGVAELGADGKVPSAQLPSAALLALGADSTTAHRGDHGTTAYTHSQIATGNPHGTTAADVGAMATADPVFTGTLKQGAVTRLSSSGGADFSSLRVSNLSSAFNGVLVSDYVGIAGVRGATDFRDNYIQAAPAAHNHFSKLDVSASTTIGSIDATAIKVTTTDVNLTLSGGVDGQGWDIVCPTTSFGISIPTGVTLYAYAGFDIGPTTRAVGGGRGIRIVRIDAATWIAPNLTW